YIKQGQLRLTLESVRERQHLLRETGGLVEEQRFMLGDYAHRKPGKRVLGIGLAIYDLMAGARTRRYWPADETLLYAPHIRRQGLLGGSSYLDAKTDDARLVLRTLAEAESHGAVTLNYLEATHPIRKGQQVVGMQATDLIDGSNITLSAHVVINATGAWADRLRTAIGAAPKMRPLRGSHLIFPLWRLPVAQAVSFMHPWDGRPVFAYPWEGVALLGTTDLDHADVTEEAAISPKEVAYLMAAVDWQFPDLGLGLTDVLSTYAGVRPVLATGAADPSKEARDHVVLQEDGMITVTGGKLTTFRTIALDALKHVAARLPHWAADLNPTTVFAPSEPLLQPHVPPTLARRLQARYGVAAANVIASAQADELTPIGSTTFTWAELRWAAQYEQVAHLEDLLLRRTRLGLLLPQGGRAYLPRMVQIAADALGWDAARRDTEAAAYTRLIATHYSLPDAALIPAWDVAPTASH
ncbi:MAG: glycerol-3-phosphate dehydrogenase/oxidase, partial [Burkholderiales bacterium]|nr:glycerol-3-phosphate dehydrogenase/oxidase [Burkholderiales bacterium]